MNAVTIRGAKTFLVVVSGALLTACGSSIQVDTMTPPSSVLAQGRTYTWRGGSGGADGNGLLANNPEVDRLIRRVIDEELQARGFTKATGGRADLGVAYAAALEGQIRVDEVNRFYGYRRGAYIATWTEVEEFDLGSLVIDISDPASGELVWRGSAETELDRTDREYRESMLRRGVEAILDGLMAERSRGS